MKRIASLPYSQLDRTRWLAELTGRCLGFTLHSHGAKPQKNSTLRSRRVSKSCKGRIRGQLERIGINEFSVYYTLDRLVSDSSTDFLNSDRKLVENERHELKDNKTWECVRYMILPDGK
jgi:hypothetical protein